MNDNKNEDIIVMREKIYEAIKECEKHIQWADYALFHIKEMFPLTIKKYEVLKFSEERLIENFKNNGDSKLEDMKTGYFDQFLYRYTKLQDTIGASIVRPLSNLLEYSSRTLSFIDCLNILEKNYILEKARDFEKLRDIRNSITHEYSNNIEEQVEVLNNVYKSYKDLLVIVDKIKKLINQ